ncbi:diguanylate cyclase [Erwinia sp. Leaf53]|uniref:sensor domain-containing diguanylate cyclase n=1 Tax=Erwinia sp. Leaf53 TaxID=1736225 RepID=UPI00070039E2|nr:diguanylate cyclase [Erwinia sp. Leaf53]KQN64091.1 histidine kinase [Erwinia sp. Leaf53]
MHYYSPDHNQLALRSTRFVRRMFAMRQLGTFLCFMPILSVLTELQRGSPFYLLLAINAFVWPWLAYRQALSSPDPTGSEKRNLTLDAAFGGLWVGMMSLSPMPSLIVMAVLASDRYAAGGWPQLKPAVQAFLLVFLFAWLGSGMHWQGSFSTRTVWLTLPLAAGYILVLSAVSYQLTLSLRRKNRELERISLMDPSLEIPNRRLFDRRLQSEFLRSRRKESRAWLLLLDVDNFKQVNDTWGHAAGDFLLAEISALLRNSVGPTDIPARFGGDELGVIVRDADETSVLILATTLQEQISCLRLPGASELHCSISIGIAAASEAETLQHWLSHADRALYHVKRSGRNAIHIWRPE